MDSRLLKSSIYWFMCSCRIHVCTVLECDTGHILPRLLPQGNVRCWELVNTLKMHLFLTGSGSLAAMAVFEAKFRPDMEVCKSLQFYSCKFFSNCMSNICKLLIPPKPVRHCC